MMQLNATNPPIPAHLHKFTFKKVELYIIFGILGFFPLRYDSTSVQITVGVLFCENASIREQCATQNHLHLASSPLLILICAVGHLPLTLTPSISKSSC